MNKDIANAIIADHIGTHKLSLDYDSEDAPVVFVLTDKNKYSQLFYYGFSSTHTDFDYPLRYCSSLDAMYEIEKTIINTDLWNKYKWWLSRIVADWFFADATERVEAFIKTIDKWDYYLKLEEEYNKGEPDL